MQSLTTPSNGIDFLYTEGDHNRTRETEMEIYTITRYRFDGKEYDSLKSVRRQVEYEIGAIIDSASRPIAPKDRLDIFDSLIKNHKRLRTLLSVEYTREGGDIQPEVVNILDMDV